MKKKTGGFAIMEPNDANEFILKTVSEMEDVMIEKLKAKNLPESQSFLVTSRVVLFFFQRYFKATINFGNDIQEKKESVERCKGSKK